MFGFWFPRSSVGTRLDRSSGGFRSAGAPWQAFPRRSVGTRKIEEAR